ncbi:hypothetical protein [Variovorax sp. PAMC26660]|uniref:hypothetical protein n=1 Tax=Variovorax sp. PAMC26660 TaxID=2762322 RepID=UPI00164E88D8|nr:hypothetical protein [Variovorax sp. PAMC26660]QNK66088.1 hypothetical protein H7F35_23190 [Variovorax sp. PAMC26660]
MSVKIDGNGEIIGATNTVPTGMPHIFLRTTVPPGWIAANGTVATIGNVGSGAARANADTLALFTEWWRYTDAQLPIFTNAGGASTRGASAQADWLAGKRLSVFNIAGRFLRAAGTINTLTFVNGTAYADTFRSHDHGIAGPGTFSVGGSAEYAPNVGRNKLSEAVGAAETAPVSLAGLACVKL